MDTPGGFPVQWKWRSKRTVVSENRNHAKKLKARALFILRVQLRCLLKQLEKLKKTDSSLVKLLKMA